MDGYVIIGTEIDTKSFDAQIKEVEAKLNDVEASLKMADSDKTLFSTSEIRSMKKEAEQLSNRLIDLKKKQASINSTDLSKAQKSIKKLGNETSKTIKKVGKWALGIFAVESAYGFIRNSMSTLSQYNEQIKTDVDYIRYAMATALQPIVEKMISLVYKLLSYVNYISKAWFGIDLFANASASAMNKSAKSAEKMKKSLAGFDEMNVLNNNGTTGAMGGSSSPSGNLKAPEDVDAPKWLKWIAENKETILSVLAGISGGILGIKLGLSSIKALGIGLILAGIISLIINLTDWIDQMGEGLDENKVHWDTLGKTIISIGMIVAGFGLLIGNIPIAVAGAIAIIVGLIATNWDKIKKKGLDAIKWLQEKFGFVGEIIALPIQMGIDAFDGLFKAVRGIISGIIKICKGDLAGGLKTIFKGIGNFIIGVLNAIINAVNLFITPFRALLVGVGKITGKKWTMDNIKIPRVPYLKSGGIVNMPNRGVPVGSALAGESGREGVIPLTDSQAMEELGNAIGKYITINANITNSMNGRVISRELQRIQNDNDFAFNR